MITALFVATAGAALLTPPPASGNWSPPSCDSHWKGARHALECTLLRSRTTMCVALAMDWTVAHRPQVTFSKVVPCTT